MFSLHTTLEKFKNATISGHFGFVFEENSTGKSSDYRNDLPWTDRQTDWPTNRLTGRLTDQPTDWPTDPQTDWLTDVRLTYWLNLWLTYWLTDWLTVLQVEHWPSTTPRERTKFGFFVLLLSSCFISASVLHHCPVASCFWGVPLSLTLEIPPQSLPSDVVWCFP